VEILLNNGCDKRHAISCTENNMHAIFY
jgi:hypothetical protein